MEKGALLAEIETDKATVEVESMYTGVVHKHLVKEGAIVPVNTPIAVIGEAGEEIDLAALIDEDTPVNEGEIEGTPPAAEEAQAEPGPAPAAESDLDSNLPGGVRATPLARRIAEDRGIDLTAINGSGINGRIVKKDIESAAAQPEETIAVESSSAQPASVVTPLVASVIGEVPDDKRVPLSRLRQTIGRRMADSKQNDPPVYVTHEYDMGPVMDLRKQINAMLSDQGSTEAVEKLSVNDFLVKAVALALRHFPNLNARLDGDAVLQYGHINVGNAVAVENGLLTVVCQDADRKTLREISAEVSAKAGRVREGKIQPEDISDSTFSISNLGMFDVEQFVAIINPPEAAILAVGSANQVPVVKDGELTIGWRMNATISVDHRISDGAEAARFLQKLAEFLENPVSLML